MHFEVSQYTDMEPDMAARLMVLAGYRQTSNRYRHVARVDLSDEALVEWAIREDMVRIESLRDYYRRCCAKDTLEGVPKEVMDLIRKLSQ